jgi:hypothetical protein
MMGLPSNRKWPSSYTLARSSQARAAQTPQQQGQSMPQGMSQQQQQQHQQLQQQSQQQGSEGGQGQPQGGLKAPLVAASPRSNQEEEEEDLAVELDDKASVIGLLYPPGAVRTPNQKRTQIVLLLELVRQMKRKFNEHLDALHRLKEEEMERAESRNERVAQILAELGSCEALLRPVWAPSELPDKVLEVSPEEMRCRPYETEAVREARRRAEEEKRRREEEARKDNIGERALQDMMYGTLEAKADALASAQALDRPDWMDQVPAEQWCVSHAICGGNWIRD